MYYIKIILIFLSLSTVSFAYERSNYDKKKIDESSDPEKKASIKQFEKSIKLDDKDIKVELKNYYHIEKFMKENLFLGHEGGNGGDPTRMTFLSTAKQILENKGETLVRLIGGENLLVIIEKLSIANIKLSEEVLFDNGGSLVSALYKDEKLFLYIGSEIQALSWDYIFKNKSHNIKKLVLHELLRLAEVNDDNYIISNKVYHINKFTIFEQTLKLADWMIPFSSSQLELLGEEINTTKLGCIDIKHYRFDMLLALQCQKETLKCEAKNVETKNTIISMRLGNSPQSLRLSNSINSIKAKAVLSCSYISQNNFCEDNFKSTDIKKECKLIMIDELLPNGQVLFGDKTI